MLISTLSAFWFAYVYGFLVRNGLKHGGGGTYFKDS